MRCLLLLVLVVASHAFEVTRNVNDGKPPAERVLLFAKGQGAGHLTFSGEEGCRPTLDGDGAILSVISGGGAVHPRIAWKPGEGRPASIDVGAHTYLILACRLEGCVRETHGNGKAVEKRADNLWFGVSLYNAAGERIGSASLADVAEPPGVTPATTVTLRIPLVLFRGELPSDQRAVAVGADWNATRPNQSRDFRWVIDRIAFAD